MTGGADDVAFRYLDLYTLDGPTLPHCRRHVDLLIKAMIKVHRKPMVAPAAVDTRNCLGRTHEVSGLAPISLGVGLYPSGLGLFVLLEPFLVIAGLALLAGPDFVARARHAFLRLQEA
jgi:hypothetical protein